eukprot:gnl/TRDRNA2_/TRDRNA2_177246_c2_seq3.p1 gnl/TRDRNA2_/TRDRNA2_177246_c2~~gnl/TRDRNA2_/TRDRNA2_177246_c2_seq3.p1  ORF type:complete len:399 (+),score=87.21 gnl/TRDRNA2_/TRDRNA2_177246_c2_seq3:203-1399(+)
MRCQKLLALIIAAVPTACADALVHQSSCIEQDSIDEISTVRILLRFNQTSAVGDAMERETAKPNPQSVVAAAEDARRMEFDSTFRDVHSLRKKLEFERKRKDYFEDRIAGLPRARPDGALQRAVVCWNEIWFSITKKILHTFKLDVFWPFVTLFVKHTDIRWAEPGISDQCWCCWVCPSHKNLDPQGAAEEFLSSCPQMCEPEERVIAYEHLGKVPKCIHEKPEADTDQHCYWLRTAQDLSEAGCFNMKDEDPEPSAAEAADGADKITQRLDKEVEKRVRDGTDDAEIAGEVARAAEEMQSDAENGKDSEGMPEGPDAGQKLKQMDAETEKLMKDDEELQDSKLSKLKFWKKKKGAEGEEGADDEEQGDGDGKKKSFWKRKKKNTDGDDDDGDDGEDD